MHLTVMYAPSNVYRNATTPQTAPMTERVVVVLELQRHVRIDPSMDSMWIIDSLGPLKQHDRQLTITRDRLMMTLSYVDSSPITFNGVVRLDDYNSYSSSSSRTSTCDYTPTGVISGRTISSSQMKVYIAFPT